MKRLITIVMVVITIFTVGILGINAYFHMFFRDAPKLTKEELVLCLNQNREKFNNAAKVIIKHPGILEITGHDIFGIERKDRYYYIITKNKLHIESKNKLDDEVINEVDDSSIKSILKELKFESILQMEDCIYFIEGSHLGYAHGIVYSPKKQKPEYEYLIMLEKIEDKWFYFRFR